MRSDEAYCGDYFRGKSPWQSGVFAARARRAGRGLRIGPERAPALGGPKASRDGRGGRRAPLHQTVQDELLGRRGLLPSRFVHYEVQPQGERGGGAYAGLLAHSPSATCRHRSGGPAADARPRGDACRDHRHGRLHPATRGGRARGADGPYDDKGLAREPRRPPEDQGGGARLGSRHESGVGDGDRVRHCRGGLGRRRDGRPRSAEVHDGRPRGRTDAHQSEHARRIRAQHPRPDRDDPQGRGACLLRRGQPERHHGKGAPGRHGVRRTAPEPAQDLQHAARRRRSRLRRGGGERRACPLPAYSGDSLQRGGGRISA